MFIGPFPGAVKPDLSVTRSERRTDGDLPDNSDPKVWFRRI